MRTDRAASRHGASRTIMQDPHESPASAGTSRKAVTSLILGAVSCAVPLVHTIPGAIVTLVGFAPILVWHAVQILTALIGAVFAAVGLREIKRGDGRLGGRGLAVTGVVLSAVATLAFMPAVLVGMVLPAVLEAKHRNQSM